MDLEFEWDPRKASINEAKHDVTFLDAASVFGDPQAVTYDDPDHSREEQRYLTFGRTDRGRLLVVSHTDRGARTRIISARRADRRERRIYEETGPARDY